MNKTAKKAAPKKKAAAPKKKGAKKIGRPTREEAAAKKAAAASASKETAQRHGYPPPPGGWKIEKDIPIPAVTHDYTSLYPFDQMKNGNSFFVPNVPDIPKAIKSIRSRGLYKKLSLTFMPENGGLRVWLVGKSK